MKIKVLGNYKPSKHSCGRIVNKDGNSPTIMENHGEVVCNTVDDEGMTNSEIVKADSKII